MHLFSSFVKNIFNISLNNDNSADILIGMDGYRDSNLNRIPQPETVRPVRSNCVLPRNSFFMIVTAEAPARGPITFYSPPPSES